MSTQKFKLARLRLLILFTLLLGLPAAVNSQSAQPLDLTQATQQNYLDRAIRYRRAGDVRSEQLELSKALHIWPDSQELRYNYALHLVRRKNLPEALRQTSHTLALNPDQPVTAKLHLQLLSKLNRHTEGARWIGNLLLTNRAQPPLKLWSAQWLERWTPVLQLGQQHAKIARDRHSLNLIEHALKGP